MDLRRAGSSILTLCHSSWYVIFPLQLKSLTDNLFPGGTRLTIDSTGNYVSETTWRSWLEGSTLFLGGGGGISKIWKLPSYQNGSLGKGSLGSTTFRNVPDVSLNADPDNGCVWKLGTVWQYKLRRTNLGCIYLRLFLIKIEQLLKKGSIQFMNPKLYSIGKSVEYNTFFNTSKMDL